MPAFASVPKCAGSIVVAPFLCARSAVLAGSSPVWHSLQARGANRLPAFDASVCCSCAPTPNAVVVLLPDASIGGTAMTYASSPAAGTRTSGLVPWQLEQDIAGRSFCPFMWFGLGTPPAFTVQAPGLLAKQSYGS